MMPHEKHNNDYWTEPRKELLAWFQRNAPSLGRLYEGALIMLFEHYFPGRTRFVSHAVREIRNRLPDIFSGSRTDRNLQYKNRLDDITMEWENAGFMTDETMPISLTSNPSLPPDNISVPIRLHKKIAELVRDHVEARERPEEAASRLFEAIAPENHNLRDSLRPVIIQWLDVTNWFVKRVHVPILTASEVSSEELQSRFRLFEDTLGALVRGFFKTIEGLDEILEDTNS